MQKPKSLNLGPKTPCLVISRLEFESNIVIFEISALAFFFITNFGVKIKNFKFGSKNVLFDILAPELENHIVIFEISTLEFV